jgi:hypothetical protein
MKTMKVRGRFQKQELSVGLSNLLPLAYRGPEEKYAKADMLTIGNAAHHPWRGTKITYETTTIDFEFVAFEVPAHAEGRFRCIQLVSELPEAALSEAEEELVAIRDHYFALQSSEHQPAQLPSSRPVTAKVVDHLKT